MLRVDRSSALARRWRFARLAPGLIAYPDVAPQVDVAVQDMPAEPGSETAQPAIAAAAVPVLPDAAAPADDPAAASDPTATSDPSAADAAPPDGAGSDAGA